MLPTLLPRRPALVAALGAALLAGALPAQASHTGEDLSADQFVVDGNDQLIDGLRRYEKAPKAQRAQALQRLLKVAEARAERLQALMHRNPRLAALRVLPEAVRERLPEQLRGRVEQPVVVAGEVVASVEDDFARGRSHRHLHLVDAAGARLGLGIAGADEKDLLALAGRRAKVAGLRLGRELLVLDRQQVTLAADGAAGAGTTAAAVTAAVQGDQPTLVMMVNFSDKALTCTGTDLQSRLFGSGASTLDQGYRQSSGGLVSFSGQVVGPYTIAATSTSACDPYGWASAVKAAAQAAGINLSAYKRLSYAMPSNSSCGWSGLGNLGGSPPTQSWIMSCGSTGVFSHEIGHNLTFHHASTPTSEYGDSSDPMGSARLVQSNAANRVMAGWVAGASIYDVAAGGSYALAALETADAGVPRVLRFAKPDTGETYYVSLRQPIGLDSGLTSAFQNALSVHRSTGTLPARTYLLGTVPAGQSWSDSVNGIQVTHGGISGNTANVDISFSGATCERAAPLLSVAPASQSAAPGATLAYTLNVKSQDSAACTAASYALAQTLPAGFSGSFGSAAVTLAPGASAGVAWNITSGSGSAEAAYTLDASATGPGGAGQAHAGYTVFSDTTAPQLTVTSPADGATYGRQNVALAATASDGSGVARVEFHVDGKLVASDASAPYAANWNARKASLGLHTVRVRAVDAAGNASERTVSVTIAR